MPSRITRHVVWLHVYSGIAFRQLIIGWQDCPEGNVRWPWTGVVVLKTTNGVNPWGDLNRNHPRECLEDAFLGITLWWFRVNVLGLSLSRLLNFLRIHQVMDEGPKRSWWSLALWCWYILGMRQKFFCNENDFTDCPSDLLVCSPSFLRRGWPCRQASQEVGQEMVMHLGVWAISLTHWPCERRLQGVEAWR